MNKGLQSVDEALAQLLAAARPVAEVEQVPTMAAVGRVLAQAQTSTMDVPPMDNSAMDGYAVRLSDLSSEKKLKITQRIPAGSVGTPLQPGTAARIFTGAPVPAGADAIVMQEFTEVEKETVSRLNFTIASSIKTNEEKHWNQHTFKTNVKIEQI